MNMKMKAFRIDERTLSEMEGIRDHERFPTQSDFVRTAIRNLIREERHRRIRTQLQAARTSAVGTASGELEVSAAIEDWFERLDRADRGEF